MLALLYPPLLTSLNHERTMTSSKVFHICKWIFFAISSFAIIKKSPSLLWWLGPLTTLKNWSGTTTFGRPSLSTTSFDFFEPWEDNDLLKRVAICEPQNLVTCEQQAVWPKFWLSSSKFEYPKVGQILTKERNDLWARVININSFSAATMNVSKMHSHMRRHMKL